MHTKGMALEALILITPLAQVEGSVVCAYDDSFHYIFWGNDITTFMVPCGIGMRPPCLSEGRGQ
jgi:hypothetical protein